MTISARLLTHMLPDVGPIFSLSKYVYYIQESISFSRQQKTFDTVNRFELNMLGLKIYASFFQLLLVKNCTTPVLDEK